MRRNTRVKLAVIGCVICSIGVTATAQAGNAGKVLLCHGTASDNNPYVLISVSVDALAGHMDGTAPGHGKNNYPDFLPAAGSTDCSRDAGGTE
jgi:hypothetical protein